MLLVAKIQRRGLEEVIPTNEKLKDSLRQNEENFNSAKSESLVERRSEKESTCTIQSEKRKGGGERLEIPYQKKSLKSAPLSDCRGEGKRGVTTRTGSHECGKGVEVSTTS